MTERKIPITEGKLEVDKDALFAGFQKDLDDTKQLMKYVVLVLLVMVAGMIIGLLIAIWQSRQASDVHLIFDEASQSIKLNK